MKPVPAENKVVLKVGEYTAFKRLPVRSHFSVTRGEEVTNYVKIGEEHAFFRKENYRSDTSKRIPFARSTNVKVLHLP